MKVVKTKEEQEHVLHACHSEPTSGHFGVSKTLNRIRERFYWKGMVGDVRELVSYYLPILATTHDVTLL